MSNNEPSDIAKKKQEIAGVFSRAAPTYDRVGPRFFSHFGRRLVKLARIPSDAQVLDVATGKGAILFPAVEAVGPRGHVTGIDLSEVMVKEANEEIRRQKLETVEVRQMDAEYLQFPDGSFDCVLCGFALFFFPQLDRALSEMRRTLRPNGKIAVTTFDRFFIEQWKWFDGMVRAYLPPEDEKEMTPELQSPLSPELDRPEGLEGVMKKAGFTDVEVIPETFEIVYASEQEWWSMLWSGGKREDLERIEAAIGTDGLDRFRISVFERLKTIKQADGIHQLWPVLYTLATKPQA